MKEAPTMKPNLSLVRESQDERLALAREKLEAKPDGVIEAVAAEAGLPTQAVLELTPKKERLFVPPEAFEAVWAELSTWGDVLFIVHTRDIVCEVVGSLPEGASGQGYFNIHGDSPIGGHIRASNCRAIYLVDRPFHGRRSCSVQFFNAAGEAMFKVFVRRDKARELLPEQLAKFDALKMRSFT
jgi:heme iron utilization protein